MARIARTLPALAVLLSACGAAPAPGQPAASAMAPHASAKDPTAATDSPAARTKNTAVSEPVSAG